MTFSEYIESLKRRETPAPGFIGFGHPFQDFQSLRDACRLGGIPVAALRTSRLERFDRKRLAAARHLLFYQDLAIAPLRPLLDALFHQILQPFLQTRRPICFLSALAREAYDGHVSSASLHESLDRIWEEIYLEQLRALWKHPLPPLQTAPQPPDAIELDADLDASQSRAVNHGAGPIRVLAPAGSGKTKTLTNRIMHLVNQGVATERILALAFNKKAADEMAERLLRRGVPVARRLHQAGVVVRTFHGLGYEWIRTVQGWSYRAEEEENRLRRLMQQAVEKHYKLPPRRNQDMLEPFLAALSTCKMDLPPLEGIEVELEEKTLPFAPVFSTFLQLQQQHKFCNFDDMIYWAVRLLLERAGLRHEMQQRFEYLLVDEFQDLNRAQLLMMQLLALPRNNLFVVGDDDQMIYGWRGADIRHILEFPRRYAGATDCTLSTNYRSSQAIVRHAAWLIRNNHHRVAKTMNAVPGAAEGSVAFHLADSLWHQAQNAASWLAEQHEHHQAAWNECAVLFRYHAYKYVIAILLDARGIPHEPVGGASLAQTPVGRDLHAYLGVLLDPQAAPKEWLTRILKRPNKFFTNQFILAMETWDDIEVASRCEEMTEWMRDNLQLFAGDLHNVKKQIARGKSTSAVIALLADIIGLRAFYQQQENRMTAQDEAGMDVLLDVFISVANAYDSVADFFKFLDEGLQHRNAAVTPDAGRAGVHLSTIHAAKGREFKEVVLYNLAWPGLHETVELEEERRVAYVGATRASHHLLVTAPAEALSPFLHELAHDPQYILLSDSLLKRRLTELERAPQKKRTQATIAEMKSVRDELERRRALPLRHGRHGGRTNLIY